MSLLEVRDIHTYYGKSYILQGVSLDVERGTVVAVLGRNGVGKTTLIRSICGLTPPRRGAIVFNGRNIVNQPSHRISAMGIGLIPQGRRVFPSLTVEENLRVAQRLRGGAGWTLGMVLETFPRLRERIQHRGGKLSGGEQQMLAISRGLMSDPRCLLLDEPSLGLAPLIVDQLAEIIKTLHDKGLTILLVEQNAVLALELADRGYVLETGEIVLEGTGQELLNNELVQRAYLGI